MGLLQEIVYNAATKLECQTKLDKESQNSENLATNELSEDVKKDAAVSEPESNTEDNRIGAESSSEDKRIGAETSSSGGKRSVDIYNIFLQLPQSDVRNLGSLLGREGYYFHFIYCLLFFFFFCSSSSL